MNSLVSNLDGEGHAREVSTEGRPACHAWLVDQDFDRYIAGVMDSVFPSLRPAERDLAVLALWQECRCALCGTDVPESRLVKDHDHDTGLVRGLLCRPCNTIEAHTTSFRVSREAVRAYRQQPATARLGLRIPYRKVVRVAVAKLLDGVLAYVGV